MNSNHTTTSTTTTTDNPNAPEALAPDDPRRHFAAAVAVAADVMATIPPEQYNSETPCAGMTVGSMQEHLVMVLRRIAAAGRGEAPSTWPVDAEDVAEGDWLDAWRAAAHDVQAAWGDDVLDRPIELPWGVFPGHEVLGVYTNEISAHTWDMAVATAVVPEWDQPSLEFALDAIHAQLPMADRTPMWEATKSQLPADYPWEDPFGPAVPVSPDAPTIDRLVAWNGRDPGWRPTAPRD